MTLAAPLALGAGVAGAAAGEVQPGSIDTRAIGGTPVETTIVAPELGSPQGIEVDASGSIYVVGDRQVLVRSTAGKFRAIGYGYDTNPKGVAVDGAGNVYVVDSDNDRVLKRTPSGAVSTLGFTGLNDPRGLVADASGKVYVSDSINKRVVAITPGGALSTVAAGVGTPDDLALGPGGVLYILDTAGRKVWRVPPGGSPTALAFPAFVKPVGIAVDGAGTVFVADDTDTFSQTIRSLTTGNVAATAVAPGLTGARGLSFDAAGNLLVVDDSGVVAKRTPAGAQTFVPFGSLSISNPRGVDVGPDGTVYFSGLNNVVSAYKPGQEQRTLPFSGLKTPRDVAVDGAGNVYVADVDLDQVLKLTPAGVQSTVSFGALVNPYGLAVDSANNLYVADRTGAGNSVYKRTPGGTVTNAGFTGLNGPLDIDVDSAGTLYVIDAAVGGGTRVLKRTTGGTQTTLPFTGTLLGQWVTVDSSGSVYVSKDGANRKVARLTTGGVETLVDLTGSVSPNGLAVGPDDALYVADSDVGDPKIRRKLPNAFEVELGQDSVSDGPSTSSPAMAIGAGGQLLIADRNGDRILEYPGGGTAAPVGFSGMTDPTSIAADDSGHMYIAATGLSGRAVYDRAPNGTAVTLGFAPTRVGELVVDSVGTIYSLSAAGLYKLPKGGVETKVTIPAVMGGDVRAYAIGPDDSLYFVNTIRTVRMSKTGVVTDLGWDSGNPVELAVDKNSNLFVVDSGSWTVKERFANGATATVPFTKADSGSYLAVDAAGTVYQSGSQGVVKLTGWPPFGPFSSWNAVVTRQYTDLLGRAPTASELSTATAQLSGGSKTLGQIDDALRRGSENTTNVDPTARLYRAFLGRGPDAGGLKFWIGRRRAGTYSLTKMADSFAASNEFKTKYGSLSNRAFVTRIYTDVLGRTADTAGVNYWTGKLDRKERTRGGVMVGFSESNEYKRKQLENTDVSVAYILLMGRAPTTAEASAWVTAQKGGTTHAVLLQQLLDSDAYAARIKG